MGSGPRSSSCWAISQGSIGLRRCRTAALLLCIFLLPFHCRAFKGVRQSATVAWEFRSEDCKRGIIPAIYNTSIFGEIKLNASLYCPETTHGVGNKMRLPRLGARGKTGRMGPKAAADMDNGGYQSGDYSVDVWLRLTEETPFGTRAATAMVFADYGANRNELYRHAAKIYAKGSKIYAADYQYTDYTFFNAFTPWQGKPVWVHVGVSCGASPWRGFVTTDDDPVGACLYYINGETDLNKWESSDQVWFERTELSLFAPEVDYSYGSQFSNAAAWVGEIHYVAVYNRSLSPDDMYNQYNAGLPHSEPYAFNASVSVVENGEVLGRNYDNPAFYLSPVPVLELVNVTLTAGDADHELGHPNYNASDPDTSVFIASLPSRGTLYHMNGTAITRVPTRLSTTVDCSSGDGYCHVRYRPLWKEASHPSVYTSFTYYAVDGLSGNHSSTATLEITVTEGHVPPTATNTSAVSKAGKYVAVELSGSVGGSNSSVTLTSASVHSLPKDGRLFQVFANGTVATHARITSPGTLLWSWHVAYQYTGLHNRTAVGGYLAHDSFTYTVRDSRGYRSLPASVNVSMTPALAALPQPALAPTSTATQEVRSPIRLFGMDESDLRRPLCAQLRSLPSHGQLYANQADTTPLSDGAVLSDSPLAHPYTAGVELFYQSSGPFFTSPNTTFDRQPRPLLGSEGFDFRFVDCGSPSSTSDTATQPLSVVNVNDASSLSWPVDKDPFRLTSSTAFTGTWSLQHLLIEDEDEDVDPIKMHVSTNDKRCALTFDAGALWAVSTLARSSKEIVVRGMPSALTLLLNSGAISCFRRASDLTPANLTITLFDGLGAPCLPQSVFTTYSNRSAGCLITSTSLSLSAPPDAPAPGMQLWFIIAVSVGASVAFLCLVCALAWYVRRYRARLEMAGYASQNTPTSAAAARAAALNDGVTSDSPGGLRGSRVHGKPARAFFPTVQEGPAADERGGNALLV